jgi:hypothetical protein
MMPEYVEQRCWRRFLHQRCPSLTVGVRMRPSLTPRPCSSRSARGNWKFCSSSPTGLSNQEICAQALPGAGHGEGAQPPHLRTSSRCSGAPRPWPKHRNVADCSLPAGWRERGASCEGRSAAAQFHHLHTRSRPRISTPQPHSTTTPKCLYCRSAAAAILCHTALANASTGGKHRGQAQGAVYAGSRQGKAHQRRDADLLHPGEGAPASGVGGMVWRAWRSQPRRRTATPCSPAPWSTRRRCTACCAACATWACRCLALNLIVADQPAARPRSFKPGATRLIIQSGGIVKMIASAKTIDKIDASMLLSSL